MLIEEVLALYEEKKDWFVALTHSQYAVRALLIFTELLNITEGRTVF